MKKTFFRKVRWIALLMVIAFLTSKFFYQFMMIRGDSMNPAFFDKQLVVLNKYDKDYAVGDVIAFWSEGLDCVLVKRIADIKDNGKYYVLGDNLSKSIDSRDARVGDISRKDIIGRVIG